MERPTRTVAGRPYRILAAGLAVYLAILATMVVLESYTFVLKSSIVPFLLVAAIWARRFGGFVNDWAMFLGATVLFDSLRSLIYTTITHFELPMYAAYAIDWDRWLCGGEVAPVIAQGLRAWLGEPLWLDRLFVLLHASHFLFFLLFGFLLWLVRRELFRTYAVAMLALLYAALLIHLVAPTIPPWMAAENFQLLPPVPRLISSLYNTRLPSLVAIFDVNPIAAMPSLHTAMPALCALLAWHYLGWVGAVVTVYAIGVWLGILYLGEHYLVDVLAGVLLASVVYAGVRRWGTPAGDLSSPSPRGKEGQVAFQPIAVALGLVVMAFLSGQLATRWLGPLPITTAFVEREMLGRSPAAHYLLGRIAFEKGDFSRAKAELTQALTELQHPEQQKVIHTFLARITPR